MGRPLRVGVVGARGIGKHHAKWYARAGCEVTAVYGTTAGSATAAAAALRELFGFTGRAFHDWERFRREGGFEACSICTPADTHAALAADLAAAGVHLLCEKPLAWNWEHAPEEILRDAAAVILAAERHRVILGVNAQYPAALEGYRELHRRLRGGEPVFSRLTFVLETRGAPRSPHGPAEAWVDLGPHPLAMADAVAPGGPDWSTLRHSDGPREAVVDVDWLAGERRIPLHVECRRTTDGAMRRCLGNQDLVVDYEGCNVDGEFRACLKAGGETWVGKDFMQVSVERFVDAVRSGDAARVLVDGPSALRQQEALVGVWDRCWRR
jgi:predicted dehydrogenase